MQLPARGPGAGNSSTLTGCTNGYGYRCYPSSDPYQGPPTITELMEIELVLRSEPVEASLVLPFSDIYNTTQPLILHFATSECETSNANIAQMRQVAEVHTNVQFLTIIPFRSTDGECFANEDVLEANSGLTEPCSGDQGQALAKTSGFLSSWARNTSASASGEALPNYKLLQDTPYVAMITEDDGQGHTSYSTRMQGEFYNKFAVGQHRLSSMTDPVVDTWNVKEQVVAFTKFGDNYAMVHPKRFGSLRTSTAGMTWNEYNRAGAETWSDADGAGPDGLALGPAQGLLGDVKALITSVENAVAPPVEQDPNPSAGEHGEGEAQLPCPANAGFECFSDSLQGGDPYRGPELIAALQDVRVVVRETPVRDSPIVPFADARVYNPEKPLLLHFATSDCVVSNANIAEMHRLAADPGNAELQFLTVVPFRDADTRRCFAAETVHEPGSSTDATCEGDNGALLMNTRGYSSRWAFTQHVADGGTQSATYMPNYRLLQDTPYVASIANQQSGIITRMQGQLYSRFGVGAGESAHSGSDEELAAASWHLKEQVVAFTKDGENYAMVHPHRMDHGSVGMKWAEYDSSGSTAAPGATVLDHLEALVDALKNKFVAPVQNTTTSTTTTTASASNETAASTPAATSTSTSDPESGNVTTSTTATPSSPTTSSPLPSTSAEPSTTNASSSTTAAETVDPTDGVSTTSIPVSNNETLAEISRQMELQLAIGKSVQDVIALITGASFRNAIKSGVLAFLNEKFFASAGTPLNISQIHAMTPELVQSFMSFIQESATNGGRRVNNNVTQSVTVQYKFGIRLDAAVLETSDWNWNPSTTDGLSDEASETLRADIKTALASREDLSAIVHDLTIQDTSTPEDLVIDWNEDSESPPIASTPTTPTTPPHTVPPILDQSSTASPGTSTTTPITVLKQDDEDAPEDGSYTEAAANNSTTSPATGAGCAAPESDQLDQLNLTSTFDWADVLGVERFPPGGLSADAKPIEGVTCKVADSLPPTFYCPGIGEELMMLGCEAEPTTTTIRDQGSLGFLPDPCCGCVESTIEQTDTESPDAAFLQRNKTSSANIDKNPERNAKARDGLEPSQSRRIPRSKNKAPEGKSKATTTRQYMSSYFEKPKQSRLSVFLSGRKAKAVQLFLSRRRASQSPKREVSLPQLVV
ncbi:unnamed protein product [Amoebophrya sp. A120]|nr:unnamed protein product [Amoebophrya sp. A120]|eukprot:GSA120T00026042001.1